MQPSANGPGSRRSSASASSSAAPAAGRSRASARSTTRSRPSFQVSPAKGLFYCFGCQVGGDVFDFLVKLDHLTFSEAVEQLAGRTGVQLRYEEAGSAPGRQQGQRTRLIAAHTAAAHYYAEQLSSPEAEIGRAFLRERGFDDVAAKRFGVGYAPSGWEHLTKHLRGEGFTDAELLAGGLVAQGQRGVYDRFRGRLVWPIRDLAGDVVGFGARKLQADDDGPKYLNTPETPIYKKGQVLYGLDVARREIAKTGRAVVVEGYTDVMACHLAGVETAIATCGTAFGSDHIKVLRRLLMDDDALRGEVIFTFDGDAAGQKAAVRAFGEDQQFVTRTFVAVEPTGMDPCELRQARGDEAVRALVDSRVPLFEFAIKATLAGEDLTVPEGRIAALREAAPVVARIRDVALRDEYARRLSGWLGMEVRPVAVAVTAARSGRTSPDSRTRQPAPAPQPPSRHEGQPAPARPATVPRPDPSDHRLAVDRELLKCAIQVPALLGDSFDALTPEVFGHPAYVLVATVHRRGRGSALGGRPVGRAAATGSQRRGDPVPGDRARRRAAALRRAAGRPLCQGTGRSGRGTGHGAAGGRAALRPAAPRRLRPGGDAGDVRRARGPRAAPPRAARARRGQRVKLHRRERHNGEVVLASGTLVGGEPVLATPLALYVPSRDLTLPWERVAAATWDDPELRVVTTGVRQTHALTLDDAGLLPEVIRERVQASILVSEHVRADPSRGRAVQRPAVPDGGRRGALDGDVRRRAGPPGRHIAPARRWRAGADAADVRGLADGRSVRVDAQLRVDLDLGVVAVLVHRVLDGRRDVLGLARGRCAGGRGGAWQRSWRPCLPCRGRLGRGRSCRRRSGSARTGAVQRRCPPHSRLPLPAGT